MTLFANQVSDRPGAACLRCGGLLVLTYMASLEPDLTGNPMRLWRCVNCGNCVDHFIMANRGKGSNGPTRNRRPQNRTKTCR
jgi:hypothetical protein